MRGLAFAALLGLPLSAIVTTAAAIAAPDRMVADNVVISHADPAVAIGLPKAVRYAGSDRFVLHDPKLGDFDACELFAFAAAGADGTVRKLYWVQFESYLPSQPGIHHTYDSPRHATMGGLDFYVDASLSRAHSKPEPGSDTEHYNAVLAAHGYRRGDMMTVRFVHLTDASRRKELMIIYREALPPGLTAASLAEGGKDHARWPALRDRLIARGLHAVKVTVLTEK